MRPFTRFHCCANTFPGGMQDPKTFTDSFKYGFAEVDGVEEQNNTHLCVNPRIYVLLAFRRRAVAADCAKLR
jgi:hypothetical protein